MEKREIYPVDIAGVHRELTLFEVKPGLRIAILNLLGDTELVQACATELANLLAKKDYDVGMKIPIGPRRSGWFSSSIKI